MRLGQILIVVSVHEIISTSVDPTRLDRLVVAMLVLPLLQFLSSPDLYKTGQVLSTAGAILDAVEIYIEQGTSSSKICVDHPENVRHLSRYSLFCFHLSLR